MDVESFEKILNIVGVPHHSLILYTLYYYFIHLSSDKIIGPFLDSLLKEVKKLVGKEPPTLQSIYENFLDCLFKKLKENPGVNPLETKEYIKLVSFMPDLIDKIREGNKKYKKLDPQTCLLLAISIMKEIWNNTPSELQESFKQSIHSNKGFQKGFKEAQEEILKILRQWEDQDYLPPKLVYESHFKRVEEKRKEELKKLEHYVPLELEVKLAQKGGEEKEARSVLLACLEKRRNAIIIGESGAGKTFTFLKLFVELKERYFNDEIPFIPLFIELYKFKPDTHVNLQDFLQRYLGIDVNRFHKDKEKYLLFLDGLNESPNLEEAFEEIKASQNMQIFLSTQREESFFANRGFSIYYMLPLGEDEVIQYLSYCPKLGDEEKARTLYQKLDGVLQKQIKRPVFLLFLSSLYEATETMPTNLGNLLSSFTDFVCERKLTDDGIKIKIGEPLDPTYKEDALPCMAFSMCKKNERVLKKGELKELFKHDPRDYHNFVKQVSQRYWLIRQSPADESFEFMHELLRDYFAAAYIKNKQMAIDEVIALVFPDEKPNPTFASVVHLLCGIESEERVSNLISGILKEDPYLAASCFALSTTTALVLFDNIDSMIDIVHPNYLHLDRFPHFYIKGLELLRKSGKEGESEYAYYQDRLGTAYFHLSKIRNKGANLKLAINAYNEALKIRTFEQLPREYAVTQYHLGLAYAWLPKEVGGEEINLKRAIEACNQALKVFNFKEFPLNYCQTQNLLGIAYLYLSNVRKKEANLQLAIDAYNKALKACDFEQFPWYHAEIQHNLGITYSDLSEVKNKEENLGRAIGHYNEALKVRTFEKFPYEYAVTQNSLGNAYRKLSDVRNKEANIELAIKAYRKALMVQTKDALPWNFVETSFDLALALDKKGDIVGALRIMEDMLPVAKEVGHPRLEDYRQFYEHLKPSR